MVKFGDTIVARQQEHSEWSPFYLDYAALKRILEDYKRQQHHNVVDDHSDALSLLSHDNVSLSSPVTVSFLHLLQSEVEKISLFVIRQQGQIADQLYHCKGQLNEVVANHQQQSLAFDTEQLVPIQSTSVDDLESNYFQVGSGLLELYLFLDLNVQGIRKILKKHDKVTRSKLSANVLSLTPVRKLSYLQYSNQLVQALVTEANLGALTASLESGLRTLHSLSERQQATHRRQNSAPNAPDDTLSKRNVQQLLNSPSVGSLSEKQQTRKTYQRPDSEVILLRIRAAQQRLQQTNNVVEMLAAQLIMEETPSEGEGYEEEEEEEKKEEARPAEFSNLLNLLSTTLYMTNYYIVAPTSANYAAKLGSDASLASLIIGMTPVAALVSTVLYSWWTSHSYKSALMFASACSVIGNLCYALGLPFDSLRLVMIGRLLNGFGSARSINRRYIADTFSNKERTAASAAFVTAGAMGMAAGPAIASALHLLINQQSSNLYWQAENAPGWFMFVVWSLYSYCLIRYFRDPPKRNNGLNKRTKSSDTLKASNGEQQPLQTSSERSSSSDMPLWRNVPVMITFFVYFVLKLLLEAVLSAAAMLTDYYFSWHATVVGLYLACMGLLMLPANILVAFLSRNYEDRELIIGMQLLMFLGCVGIMQYADVYTMVQYVVFSIVLFVSANALEGPNMSLLSKTIPKSWSKGIFNVGLLATEAGTLGRAVGDVLLSLFGSGGLEHLLNRTFGSFALLSGISLLASYRYYDYLEPLDRDD